VKELGAALGRRLASSGRPPTSVIVNETSPDALGVVRNLPAAFTGTTFHPPVAPVRALLDLRDEPEHGGIGLGGVFALPEMACGRRIARIKTHPVVDHRLGEGFEGAHRLRSPESVPEIVLWDLDVRVCLEDPAVSLWMNGLVGVWSSHGAEESLLLQLASPAIAEVDAAQKAVWSGRVIETIG
jgi:hypothetical protein